MTVEGAAAFVTPVQPMILRPLTSAQTSKQFHNKILSSFTSLLSAADEHQKHAHLAPCLQPPAKTLDPPRVRQVKGEWTEACGAPYL